MDRDRRRGPGRPPLHDRGSVLTRAHLPRPDREALDRRAVDEGVTVAEIIRRAVAAYLEPTSESVA